MKKYIAPVAQIIDIQSENMMALSATGNEQVGFGEASNRRENTSWDDDDDDF